MGGGAATLTVPGNVQMTMKAQMLWLWTPRDLIRAGNSLLLSINTSCRNVLLQVEVQNTKLHLGKMYWYHNVLKVINMQILPLHKLSNVWNVYFHGRCDVGALWNDKWQSYKLWLETLLTVCQRYRGSAWHFGLSSSHLFYGSLKPVYGIPTSFGKVWRMRFTEHEQIGSLFRRPSLPQFHHMNWR